MTDDGRRAGQNKNRLDSPLVQKEKQPRDDLCHNGLMPSSQQPSQQNFVIPGSGFRSYRILILTAAKQVASLERKKNILSAYPEDHTGLS